MNDQQIQTETVEPIEHVETGNMTQQQGVYILVNYNFTTKYLLVWPFLIQLQITNFFAKLETI